MSPPGGFEPQTMFTKVRRSNHLATVTGKSSSRYSHWYPVSRNWASCNRSCKGHPTVTFSRLWHRALPVWTDTTLPALPVRGLHNHVAIRFCLVRFLCLDTVSRKSLLRIYLFNSKDDIVRSWCFMSLQANQGRACTCSICYISFSDDQEFWHAIDNASFASWMQYTLQQLSLI